MTRKRLIALDPGHGARTPGKRTPRFPDGSFMHEYEFNRAVATLVAVHLRGCGFAVIDVVPDDSDVPLRDRTAAANRVGADLYVSIHANAGGSGGWSDARGIETLYKPGNAASERLARTMQNGLIRSAKLFDRGLQHRHDLYVLNTARMPAALVECGFMTNKKEAELLRSEDYRQTCAEAIARGVCEYFGVTFESEATPAAKPIRVLIEDKEIIGQLIDGVTWVPARPAGNILGREIGWDGSSVLVDGSPMETRLIGGLGHVPIRAIADPEIWTVTPMGDMVKVTR